MINNLRRLFDTQLKGLVRNTFPKLYTFLLPFLESIPMRPFGNIYYNSYADDYDTLRQDTDFWKKEQLALEVDLQRFIEERSTILDVPVGTCRFIKLYQTKKINLVGVDLSKEMLAICKAKLGKTDVFATLLCSPSFPLHLESKSVDHAVSCRFLQSIVSLSDAKKTILEMKRVSKGCIFLELGYRKNEVFRWRAPKPDETMRKLLYKNELLKLLQECGLIVMAQSRVVNEDTIGAQRVFACKTR